jgi:hypothetical protein
MKASVEKYLMPHSNEAAQEKLIPIFPKAMRANS